MITSSFETPSPLGGGLGRGSFPLTSASFEVTSNHFLRSIAALSLPLLLSTSLPAEMRHDYELTVATVVKALQGWQLYAQEKFAGSFRNGQYTDPDPATKVNDFWSDGVIAKFDRDDNGHFETVFIVVDKQLVYVGSIGNRGTFIDTAGDYKKHIGQPLKSLIREIDKKRAR
jgi:hypothetical protein